MKQETAKHLADGIVTASISTGAASSAAKYLDMLDNHAAGLGVIISFLGLIMAGVFYFYTARKSSLADDNKKQIEQLKAIQQRNIDSIKEDLKNIETAIKDK